MGEKTTLELSAILITIGIFIPVVISIFFKQYGPDLESSITLKYLALAGLYIVAYCIVYWTKADNELLRGMIMINIFLVGIFTIFISLVESISRLPAFYQIVINIFAAPLLVLVLLIFPFLMVVMPIFLRDYRQNKEKKNFKMRSLIGEFIFGLGISIMAGAFVLLWDKISSYFPSMYWTYVGTLIVAGMILIIIGAMRINTIENSSKVKK